jgi:hypothetical protein
VQLGEESCGMVIRQHRQMKEEQLSKVFIPEAGTRNPSY